MKVNVIKGFPITGFIKYLVKLFIAVLIVLVPMVIMRMFFGELIFNFIGAILYVIAAFLLAVIVSFVFGIIANMTEYGHYKRTALIWIYTVTIIIATLILLTLAVLFLINMFKPTSSENERNLKRLAEFNIMLFLAPFLVLFGVTLGALSGVLSKSCSNCKILDTVVTESSEVVDSKLKRHSHTEKGHYVTDYSYVRKGYAWSNEAPEYVAEHKRWVEGKEVDDGLFEHKTTKDHMICINCGERFDRTFKSVTKIDE